jgi:hypothetical protein
MNPIIKDFQQKNRNVESDSVKQNLITDLKNHVQTLSKEEQNTFREDVISNIESKFEVMDKLIESYEAIKKDYLEFA